MSEGTVTINDSSRGTAQLVGDTTWNGLNAQVMLVEGKIEISGSGAPASAPGEIELEATGPYTSCYVWDPERGVMLASMTEVESTGDVRVISMDMVMPFRLTSKGIAELQR